jgi:hypothetical protein
VFNLGIVQPEDNMFAAFLHERVHLAVAEYCNGSPRSPSYSVGKLEFYCDRNGCFNMIYDFDPNRPMYIRGNRDSYSNFFAGMLIHDKLPILDYQEVHMELNGVGAHFDDLSACGRWLLDKKTLSDVQNWTNNYLPRTSHCRQITFYRAIAHFGTLLENVEIDGEVQMFNDESLVVGHKPKFNIKKVNILYMPMNDVTDVRVAELPRKWTDMPVQAAAKMLLDKKDKIDAHMMNGTLPERSPSYECKYCRWYDDCYNSGKYEVEIPDYLQAKLSSMPTVGGGHE